MPIQPRAISAALVACCLLAAPAYADAITITGEASYRERIALPDAAALEVQLVDVSRQDAAAEVIASATVSPAGQVPIPFTLEFDSTEITDGATYALQARIEADGELWFITDTQHTIDPLAADGTQQLALVRATAEEAAAAEPPFGTTWALTELNGGPAAEGVTTTLLLGADGSIGGNGGCNTYGGTLTVTEDSFDITDVFSTMMACDGPAMPQEQAFFAALEAATAYSLVDGGLTLEAADGTVLARFTPQA